jgi:hypothetical protein
MLRTRLARTIGLITIVLINVAILALPSRAGWYDAQCIDPDTQETFPCCAWCFLCWGCDLDEPEVVQ